MKESLAGRRLVTHIGPLTFQEFQQAFPEITRDSVFQDYLVYGGLPGLIHEQNDQGKMRLLHEMIETYIQKDIKSLIKEENIRAFNALMYLIAQNQGQLISAENLANEVGLTARTIERYFSILEATYVVYSLHSYSKNLGNELKKSRKLYFYDLGIRHAFLKDFRLSNREDIGTLHETFVHNHWHSQLAPNQELKFWRTRQKEEIDFVLLENRVPTLMEVKSTASGIPKAFISFFRRYPQTEKGIVYSLENKPIVALDKHCVEFQSMLDL